MYHARARSNDLLVPTSARKDSPKRQTRQPWSHSGHTVFLHFSEHCAPYALHLQTLSRRPTTESRLIRRITPTFSCQYFQLASLVSQRSGHWQTRASYEKSKYTDTPKEHNEAEGLDGLRFKVVETNTIPLTALLNP